MYKGEKDLVGSMSMRQQILYIMQLSQQGQTEWDNKDEKAYVNPNERYEEKKFKQRESDLVKHPERWRMLAHSMGEFVPIKKNRFLERNKLVLQPKDFMQFSCSCQPRSRALPSQLSRNRKRGCHKVFEDEEQSYDCGEQCLNRSVAQDCAEEICPVGDACRNRRFQLHQNAYVYPVKTEKKGWGLSAGEFLPKGSFVMQYVGEVFHEDSAIGQKRIEKYKVSTCTYMMRTENGEIIDPTVFGNVARFINHSCDPNCETRKWTVGKETSVGIFTRRDIEEDEELTFDYQFDTFKTPFTKCYCGTEKCKGYLGLAVYDRGEDDVNAPICQICKELVETKEQLVVCKGTCDKVFHFDCIKTIQYRVDRKVYFCKPCARHNRLIAKKEKEEALLEADEAMSDEAGFQRDQDHDSQNGSPSKQSRGRPRVTSKKQKLSYFPVREDSEAMRFKEDTPEHQLLDSLIRHEVQQIDLALKCPYSPQIAQLEESKVADGLQDIEMQEQDRKRKQGSLSRNKKRKMGVFSAYYNFYFEFCKRMKQRMKENKKTFKFRKSTLRSLSAAPTKTKTTKKVIRKKPVSKSVPKSQKKVQIDKTPTTPVQKQNPVDQKIQEVASQVQLLTPLDKVDMAENVDHSSQGKIALQTPEAPPMVQTPSPMIDTRGDQEMANQQSHNQLAIDINDSQPVEESQSLNCDTDYGGELDSYEMQMLEEDKVPSIMTEQNLQPIQSNPAAESLKDDENQQQDMSVEIDQPVEQPGASAKEEDIPAAEPSIGEACALVDENAEVAEAKIEKQKEQEAEEAAQEASADGDEQMEEESIEEEFEEEIEEEISEEVSVTDEDEEVEESEESVSITVSESSDESSDGSSSSDSDQESDSNSDRSMDSSNEEDSRSDYSSSQPEPVSMYQQQDSLKEFLRKFEAHKEQHKLQQVFQQAAATSDSLAATMFSQKCEQGDAQLAKKQVSMTDRNQSNVAASENEPRTKRQYTKRKRLVKEADAAEQGRINVGLLDKVPKKRGRPTKEQVAERLRLEQERQRLARQGLEGEEHAQSPAVREAKGDTSALAFRGLAGCEELERELRQKTQRKISSASKTRMKKLREGKTPRRDQKEKIQAKVRQQLEDFVDREIELQESSDSHNIEYRTSRLNLYEDLFNMVFVRNMDLLEVVSNLYVNWDNPWGGLVTVKLTCNQQQFQALLGIMQEAINKLMKHSLLMQPLSQSTQQKLKELNGKTSGSVLPFLVMSLQVPKIFIKKVIGYQEKTLLWLKKDHEVNFVYDEKLVSDVVYSLDETTIFRIYGKGRDVVKVSTYLQQQLDKLSVRTLSLTKEESKFILDNIKEIKAQIDPCEVRVKRLPKEKSDIKHPFFFSPNLSRDVCLIGQEDEIIKAEKELYEFYTYRSDSPDLTHTSLCCLLPVQLRDQIPEIKRQLFIKQPDVVATHFTPQRPRRHITIFMTGSWKKLIEAKNALSQITSDKIKRIANQINCSTFEEFQEFTFCQQIRFNFKILKRFVLEQSLVFLKFWDTTSVVLVQLVEQGNSSMDDFDYDSLQADPNPAALAITQLTNVGGPQFIRRNNSDEVAKYKALTPYLQESFSTGQLSSTQLNEVGRKHTKEFRRENRDKLLTYMKKYDMETALNALFVLQEESQNLPEICQGLNISKEEFVNMAFMTLQEILRKQYFPMINVYREIDMRLKAEQEAQKKFERIERLHQQLERESREQQQQYHQFASQHSEASVRECRGGEREQKGEDKERDSYRERDKHYSPLKSSRYRRSRSRSVSMERDMNCNMTQKQLKLQRYSSSRQEYVSEPQLFDHHRDGGHRESVNRYERAGDYERSEREFRDYDREGCRKIADRENRDRELSKCAQSDRYDRLRDRAYEERCRYSSSKMRIGSQLVDHYASDLSRSRRGERDHFVDKDRERRYQGFDRDREPDRQRDSDRQVEVQCCSQQPELDRRRQQFEHERGLADRQRELDRKREYQRQEELEREMEYQKEIDREKHHVSLREQERHRQTEHVGSPQRQRNAESHRNAEQLQKEGARPLRDEDREKDKPVIEDENRQRDVAQSLKPRDIGKDLKELAESNTRGHTEAEAGKASDLAKDRQQPWLSQKGQELTEKKQTAKVESSDSKKESELQKATMAMEEDKENGKDAIHALNSDSNSKASRSDAGQGTRSQFDSGINKNKGKLPVSSIDRDVSKRQEQVVADSDQLKQLQAQSSQVSARDQGKHQQKLMIRYEAEIAGLQVKWNQTKPDLLDAQKIAKRLNYGLARRSRSRSRSPVMEQHEKSLPEVAYKPSVPAKKSLNNAEHFSKKVKLPYFKKEPKSAYFKKKEYFKKVGYVPSKYISPKVKAALYSYPMRDEYDDTYRKSESMQYHDKRDQKSRHFEYHYGKEDLQNPYHERGMGAYESSRQNESHPQLHRFNSMPDMDHKVELSPSNFHDNFDDYHAQKKFYPKNSKLLRSSKDTYFQKSPKKYYKLPKKMSSHGPHTSSDPFYETQPPSMVKHKNVMPPQQHRSSHERHHFYPAMSPQSPHPRSPPPHAMQEGSSGATRHHRESKYDSMMRSHGERSDHSGHNASRPQRHR